MNPAAGETRSARSCGRNCGRGRQRPHRFIRFTVAVEPGIRRCRRRSRRKRTCPQSRHAASSRQRLLDRCEDATSIAHRFGQGEALRQRLSRASERPVPPLGALCRAGPQSRALNAPRCRLCRAKWQGTDRRREHRAYFSRAALARRTASGGRRERRAGRSRRTVPSAGSPNSATFRSIATFAA